MGMEEAEMMIQTFYGVYTLKRSPTIVMHCGTYIKPEAGPSPCNSVPTSPVTLESKSPWLLGRCSRQVRKNLCKCEHAIFTSRTCFHSRTLLRIEIVPLCSSSISKQCIVCNKGIGCKKSLLHWFRRFVLEGFYKS
jgi:hypothetical protein